MNTDKNNYYLFILVAASSSGKGKLINTLVSDNFWETVPKYSTRDNRGKDDDVVKIDDNSVNDAEEENDKLLIRQERIKYLKEVCGSGNGVVYYKNEDFYGFKIDKIVNGLKKKHIVIVLSDFNTIRKLTDNSELKNRIRVIYIASPVDERELLKRFKERENIDLKEQSDETERTIQKIHKLCLVLSSASRLRYLNTIENILPLLNEEWNNYVPYFETIKARALNIRMLYDRYIDNIIDVDYTILNFDKLDDLYSQARNIMNNIRQQRKQCKPPVFMVCAPTSSGKKTLMEIVGDLGEIYKDIVITKKYAKRESRDTDGRDGMQAIGSDGNFESYIEENNIWSWSFHHGATEYAVDKKEIQKNIDKLIAQVFISNMQQIETAKKYFPNNIVILYLHAAHTTATEDHIKKKRSLEIMKCFGLSTNSKKSEVLKKEFDMLIRTNIKAKKRFDELVQKDKDEIKQVFHDYIANISNIDHVLLNTGTRENLIDQMMNLIKFYK